MADPEGLIRAEFNWTEVPVIGTALLMKGATIDSFGDKVQPEKYYEVGKRISDGMVTLLPIDRDERRSKIILN